jgi:uncharacterized protein (DUF2235 family)
MSKNIVIFSDGTRQEGGEGNPTNIYEMFRMMENRTPRQVVFYDAGVGTGWQRVTGSAGGMGISRNIKQGYRFIFDHYEAGDQIYLFGFSRGAATVRSLSSFIHHFGILPKSRPELIGRAWKIYRRRNRSSFQTKAQDFVTRYPPMWTKIRVLGCYDTVAALGLPVPWAGSLLDGIPLFRHKFHDFTLSESVEHAFHALAIDEERKAFRPVLWDPEIDESYQTLRQVWFAGMHSDVGGGYAERGLSDIALLWLTRHAITEGLLVRNEHGVEVSEDCDQAAHDSRSKGLATLFRRQVRAWDPARSDQPILHESGRYRAESHELAGGERYRPWILDVDHDVDEWRRHDDAPLGHHPEL